MPRLRFTKVGESVWMSHLDLMRLFQRAFKRVGLPLTHTQGYNPRPSVSIALPLSVGMESRCELLDFDLEGEKIPCQEIVSRLNNALVPGIQVLDCYEDGRKIRDLAFLDCAMTLEYDLGISQTEAQQVADLFAREELLVEKKGKNGPVLQDIIPMIRCLDWVLEDTNTLQLRTLICCQNPSLNPTQLLTAIQTRLPELTPDFVRYCRMEIYDTNKNVFR